MDTDGPNSVLPPLPEFPSFDHEADDPRRKLSFSMGDQSFEPAPTKSKPETLRVYVRVRPPAEGTTGSVEVRDGSSVVMHTAKNSAQGASELNEHSFSFDSVFDQSAKQHEVFEAAMEPQVGALLKGRDTMTFAYGITNAGKTHTIQGSRTGEKRGMLPRALEAIFAALEQHRAHAAALAEGAEPPAEAAGVSMGLDAACSYELRASFLEVYGSDAYDLLAPSEERGPHGERKRTVLKLREDAGKGKVSVEVGGEVTVKPEKRDKTKSPSADATKFAALTRRPGKTLDRVLRAVDACAAHATLKTKVNCVVMRGENDDELAAFARRWAGTGVEVRFIEWMPFQANDWSAGKLVAYDDMLGALRGSLAPGERLYQRDSDAADPHDTTRWWRLGGGASARPSSATRQRRGRSRTPRSSQSRLCATASWRASRQRWRMWRRPWPSSPLSATPSQRATFDAPSRRPRTSTTTAAPRSLRPLGAMTSESPSARARAG